jgi:hypothetical protein
LQPRPLPHSAPLTFAALAAREPRLQALLNEARAWRRRKRDKNWCANEIWYRTLKPKLLALVGRHRADKDPELSTMQAYDLAYDAIYDALPDCKQCACLRLSDLM